MSIHEECGVFGVYSQRQEDVASLAYYGLYSLQHRGQEGCGIVVNDDGVFDGHKGLGLVSEVFTGSVMKQFPTGKMAVAHARYGTTGGSNLANCQPIQVNHLKGKLALAHNGNLSNALQLRRELELSGAIFHTTSDTETIAYVITRERIAALSIQEAVYRAMAKLEGAYSLVMMSSTKLIAVRDPHGFRPLCIGRLGDGWVFASESCALDGIGAQFVRDVRPGEIVIADKGGLRSITTHCGQCPRSLCVFEYIYFARPDSIIDGSCVHTARQRAGAFLALEHPVQADVVIGVPDSGLDAALGYSKQSGIPYGVGFIKNKYIARTFIQPGQDKRERSVRLKLNALRTAIEGKRVIMVDDSIVRGTTCGRLVKLLRDAGAAEVHMRISAPPFRHPCFFGTDIPERNQLLAHNRTVEEMREIIGVDSLGFLSLEACRKIAVGCKLGFCDACFSGEYPIPVPEQVDKNMFETEIPLPSNKD